MGIRKELMKKIEKAIQKTCNDIEKHKLCIKENSLKPLLYSNLIKSGIPIQDIAAERYNIDIAIDKEVATYPTQRGKTFTDKSILIEVKTQVLYNSKFHGQDESIWKSSYNELLKKCKDKNCSEAIFLCFLISDSNQIEKWSNCENHLKRLEKLSNKIKVMHRKIQLK